MYISVQWDKTIIPILEEYLSSPFQIYMNSFANTYFDKQLDIIFSFSTSRSLSLFLDLHLLLYLSFILQ